MGRNERRKRRRCRTGEREERERRMEVGRKGEAEGERRGRRDLDFLVLEEPIHR